MVGATPRQAGKAASAPLHGLAIYRACAPEAIEILDVKECCNWTDWQSYLFDLRLRINHRREETECCGERSLSNTGKELKVQTRAVTKDTQARWWWTHI